MFGRKQKQQQEAPEKPEPTNVASEVEADAEESEAPASAGDEPALDTLASLLRALGEFAFDTTEVDKATAQALFEGWASHALVSSAPPGVEEWSPRGLAREWTGMRRFATDYRKQESEYVVRSLEDLRETVWVFIESIGRALPAERASDAAVEEQISQLRTTIDSGDTAALREQARTTIGVIERAIEERFERNSRRNDLLAARVEQFAGQLLEARRQLELDSLTGLYNRAACDELLERMVHLAGMSGHVSTLFMIDVDDFKWVNDKFGHQAGDAVLKEVALCLGASFGRKEDFVARFGGDEFAVIVRTDDHEIDEKLGERVVLEARELEIPHGDEVIRVTLSVGGARLLPGEEVAAWVERADRALYSAKDQGRDRLVLAHDPAAAGDARPEPGA